MFTLKVVTPTRELFNGAVEHVRLAGVEGHFGVLAGHAPLLTILDIGPAEIRLADRTQRTLTVNGGYSEVLGDGVTVIARSAEFIEDINVERAEKAKKRAIDRLAERATSLDVPRAEAALRRSLLRLNLVKTAKSRSGTH